jgi:hypothetical protein
LFLIHSFASVIPFGSSSVVSGQAYRAEGKAFPAAAVVNVRTYGAVGDGRTDDTDAIQRAISETIGKDNTLYFPKGTYLISKPLKWVHILGKDSLWRAHLSIQGQGSHTTILRLRDNSRPFSDPGHPQALVATGSGPASGQESKDGGGVNAFNNMLYDIALHTGHGNPGAVALDFVGTNMAGLRNVSIRSGDGAGVAGILMSRQGSGPALFKNVTIEGFDYGIDVHGYEYSQTYEHITLKDQRKAGIRNTSNVLSLRKIHSENQYSVPVILNASRLDREKRAPSGNFGLITLLEAHFVYTGKRPSASAIVNQPGGNRWQGHLYLRNVTTSGYPSAVADHDTLLNGSRIVTYASAKDPHKSTSPAGFQNLPVRETPGFHQNDTAQWANVRDFGASDDDPYADDTDAIQAALNSGKQVVFFPKGKYRYNIGKTLVVKGHVKQLLGMQSTIDISSQNAFGDSLHLNAVFRFETGRHDTVYFERFNLSNERKSSFSGGIFLEHASSKVLVVKDVDNTVHSAGKYFYQNTPNAGQLFIENVATLMPWNFQYPQKLWARQWNPESHFVPVNRSIITQNGGQFWILGLKTEGARTILSSSSGMVELSGGFFYPVNKVPKDLPAFRGDKASFRLSYVVNAYKPEHRYFCLMKNASECEEVVFESRGAGITVPSYVYPPYGSKRK